MSWHACKSALLEVSRTFAIPIGMLREPLEKAVTTGYLLCRIVDTVEDEADLAPPVRDALYAAFLEVLEQGAPARHFAAAFGQALPVDAETDTADRRLARAMPLVMDVFHGLPESHRTTLRRWVGEMARGMAIYSRRQPAADGIVALSTLADLERYCYFVAGTVGHLLTELFVDTLGPTVAPRRAMLSAFAEEFGLGLQLVNIVKDVTDDLPRGWCFVPRAACAAVGIGPADLVDPRARAQAHAAMAPVLARAEGALEGALSYTLAIPPSAPDVRLFCLLPLWMAAGTLALARGNDDLFTPGRPVKLSREEVGRIVREAHAVCADDLALRAALAPLRPSPMEHARAFGLGATAPPAFQSA